MGAWVLHSFFSELTASANVKDSELIAHQILYIALLMMLEYFDLLLFRN
jgi:hypothetical protein